MANMVEKIEVNGIGTVTVSHSNKAKHISIRVKEGEVFLVLPYISTLKKGLAFLQSKQDWVERMIIKSKAIKDRSRPAIYDENTEFKSLTFSLQIKRHEGQNFIVSHKEGILTIHCPQSADMAAENVQHLIRTTIIRTLRKEAKRVLPARLRELALQHGFNFNNCTIRETTSRWGSCNIKKNISLNLYLMCLPQHLIDYVLIHELCHTVEMNHSDRFWALVDRCTGISHKEIRKEMKNYQTGI